MLIGTCAGRSTRDRRKAAAYITKADQVFPYFITTHLPPGLRACSWRRYSARRWPIFRRTSTAWRRSAWRTTIASRAPHSTERQRLFVAKIIVAVCGALCVVVATCWRTPTARRFRFGTRFPRLSAGGLAGLFLLGISDPRASPTAAYIAIAASLVFTAWATLTLDGGAMWNLGRYNFPFHNYMIGVIGHVLVWGVGYAASFAIPNRDPLTREMTLWGLAAPAAKRFARRASRLNLAGPKMSTMSAATRNV